MNVPIRRLAMTCLTEAASAPEDLVSTSNQPVIVFDKVSLAFDDNVILNEVSFAVREGRMAVLLGASGSGKSVVLKLILGLLKPDSGIIRLNGVRIDTLTEAQMMKLRGDIGMLFQESALFDSLSVADNVGYQAHRGNAHAAGPGPPSR